MRRTVLRTALGAALLSVPILACQEIDPAFETEPAALDELVTSAGEQAGTIIPGRYIVVFRDDIALAAPSQLAAEMVAAHGGVIDFTYSAALRGFAAELSEHAAAKIAKDSAVAYVEPDRVVTLAASQSPATWGIDRVDQRDLPLDNTYHYNTDASNVNVYVIDTGIRITHNEFETRGHSGYDAIGDGRGTDDCHGHGTHVAGTIVGTTYGLAKKARVWAVRVLNCQGSGSNAGVIAGVDWVTNNHSGPSVANMSLGGSASSPLDTAVKNSIAAGVVYAVAAGNDNGDACNKSPARVAEALTAGATTSSDARSSFSNKGTCVKIFAPGSSITSAWSSSNSSTNTISGTSMASPHVAGGAALYLAANPTSSPAQVFNAVLDAATTGRLSDIGTGSPNKLLYTLFGAAPPPEPPPPEPPPPGCTVQNDFESSATGWSNSSQSTCSTGAFVRGTPEEVVYQGVRTQVGGDHTTGTGKALFTAHNTSAGTNDVDGGVCILESPVYSVSERSELSIWYFYGQRDSGDDPGGDFFHLELSTNGGSSYTSLASHGDSRLNAAWTNRTAAIPAGSSVKLRVRVSDGAGPGDLIEGGIDDLSICAR